MLRYDNVMFRYEPFPLGVAQGIFSEADYRELVASFPGPEYFQLDKGLGRRFSFSVHNGARDYRAFLRRNPAWAELYRWVSSGAFVASALEMLLAHGVDLGIPPRGLSYRLLIRRLLLNLRYGQACSLRIRPPTQMVFAAIPADGGSLLPHTDSTLKVFNLAIAMCAPGEWDASFGGGTDIVRPKDVRCLFNRADRRLGFDEVEVLDTVPFRPNQALLVVRSDTSWHSIRPMSATGSPLLRRSVNINLLGFGI